jgi:UDP-3-O-acyl-N-acetylglucosamine deacetylase
VLDYPHPFLSGQKAEFCITPDIFEKEIAPARTFITEEEALEVQRRRLGLGGGPENTIMIRRDGGHQSALRFTDECVRHKILDIVGDLSLLGFPIIGRIIGLRSGHMLNRRLLTEILKQKECYG